MDSSCYNFCYTCPIPVGVSPVWPWQYPYLYPTFCYNWNPNNVLLTLEPSTGTGGHYQHQPWAQPGFQSAGFNMYMDGKPVAREDVSQRRPTRTNKAKSSVRGCVFCLSNGENIQWAKNHSVKNAEGEVTCPVLRNYKCPICGKTGKEAHTRKYCPSNTDAAGVGKLRTSTGRSYSKKY